MLVALACASPARAADIVAYHSTGLFGAVGYEATVVWGRGEYLLDLWVRVGKDTANLAKNRQAAESALEKRLEAVFLQSVVNLTVSSAETVGQRLKTNPALLPAIRRLLQGAVKRGSAMDQAMEDLRLYYAIPLYGADGLLSLLSPAGRPSPFESYLGFVPAAAYTGLVIYVQGSYPAWGRDGAEATLKPCLFPRIYDTNLDLVMDASRADRARLLSWGLVAYSNDLDEASFAERVGSNPLRTVARGIYGVNDTDVVISLDMAHRLLSREENTRLLREGRVLLVLDAQSAPPPSPEANAAGDTELQVLGAGGAPTSTARPAGSGTGY